jgi:cytochrome c-type biogenesis protein CcmH/NrfF
LVCWLVPTALVAIAGAVIGVQVHDQLSRTSYRHNSSLGREIAARYATSGMPIEWSSVGSGPGGHFRLNTSSVRFRIDPPKDPSGMGREYTVSLYSEGPTDAGRPVFYTPVRVSQYAAPPPEFQERVDRYVTEVNTKMSGAVGEMEPRVAGKNDLLWGWMAGLSTLAVLVVGFVFLRRRKRRSLEAAHKELIAATGTEFAAELLALPEPLDLNQPAAVKRLVIALVTSGTVPKPLVPRPAWLLHRLFAPF